MHTDGKTGIRKPQTAEREQHAKDGQDGEKDHGDCRRTSDMAAGERISVAIFFRDERRDIRAVFRVRAGTFYAQAQNAD